MEQPQRSPFCSGPAAARAAAEQSPPRSPSSSCSSSSGVSSSAPPRGQSLRTAAWIVLWVALSVSIIIVNKHIMTYTAFNKPFALALWHMGLASVTARTAMVLTRTPDAIREHGGRQLYAQMGVIGVLFAAVLVSGNAALQLLSVPCVQMLKAGGPATIYLMGMAMGSESFELLQAVKVLVVCTGVAVASYGDISLTATGLVLQLSSIVMDATRCCYLQKALQHADVKVTPLVTLAHVAPAAAAALAAPTLLIEGRGLVADFAAWRPALPAVLLSGLLASALNLVIFKIISLTSALTTSLCGVIKEWATILLAMYVYGTAITSMQWGGYSIAIAGLLWYQSSRILRGAPPPPPPSGKRPAKEAAVPLLISAASAKDLEAGGGGVYIKTID